MAIRIISLLIILRMLFNLMQSKGIKRKLSPYKDCYLRLKRLIVLRKS